MNPHYYLPPLALAMALTLANSAKAAEPLRIHKLSFETVKQSFDLVLPNQNKSQTQAKNSLHFVSQVTSPNQITHVRMQQYYSGFLIFGGFAIMHSSSSAEALANTQAQVSMTGTLYPHLETDLGPMDPLFVNNTKEALKRFKNNYIANHISEEEAAPVIYIDTKHKAHWAYKVSLFVQAPDAIPQKPTAILDAASLKPLLQWDNIQTQAVQGKGFGGNEKIGKYQYGSDLPYLNLSRDETNNLCVMKTLDLKVVDMDHKTSGPNMPLSFFCASRPDAIYTTGKKADGYDAFNGAYSPSDDAMHAGSVVKQLYTDWYRVPVLQNSDGNPMPLIMRVHYGKNYENAFWDGKQMTFGDGSKHLCYPLVSVGLAAHEISHGFTTQHANLDYVGESGGINESFSDMAAQAAEFYSTGKNSWKIGEEILKSTSGLEALRYMDKPSKDGSSVDDLPQYYAALKDHPEGLDVHYSSGVFNHLFYILANLPGWNVHQAFDVMVYANMSYWGPYDSFVEAGCGTMSAAKELHLNVEDVKKALLEVGIDPILCT